jgi:hypothetical protein
MKLHRRHNRRANSAALATTASAMIALVAVAAAMSSLPGAHGRASLLETRGGNVEAPSVRQVAAAVAAAARDLVGAETITIAIPSEAFELAPAAPLQLLFGACESVRPIQSRAIDEHLIDLPPPAC